MFVIFVSHQWLSSAHPDPQGQQAALGVLPTQLMRASGLGFWVWGLGLGVCDTGFKVKDWGLGCGVLGLGFRFRGLGSLFGVPIQVPLLKVGCKGCW